MSKSFLRNTNAKYYKLACQVIEKYFPVKASENKTNELIKSPQFKSLSNVLPSVVSVIDITKKEYLYMSPNVKSLLGYDPEEFYNEGFLKTISLFPPEQTDIILHKLFPLMFDSLEKYSKIDDIENLRICYSSLFNLGDGSKKWFLHQISVLSKDEKNKAHLLLKQVVDIHEFKTDGNIVFTLSKKDQSGIYKNIYKHVFVPPESNSPLSAREAEVLQLMAQGLSSREIGMNLSVSEHTIYKHRKNMLKKMNVKRTGELLKKAMGNGVL